jgi:hypothetical protein
MKISPCPFCGSSNVGVYQKSFVQCRNCIATGPFTLDGQEIDLWNTRTGTTYNGKTAEEWCKLYAAAVTYIDMHAATSSPSSAGLPTAPCPPPLEALSSDDVESP